MLTRSQALSILTFQEEAGIDTCVDSLPSDKRTFQDIALTLSLPKIDPPPLEPTLAPSQDLAPVLKVTRSTPVVALKKTSQVIGSARDLANGAQTLPALREAMLGFSGCDLKTTATNMVFSDGVEGAPIMCVGEAPGADEDRLGKPFVGMSGQLLDKMLATIGLSREKNVYISNIIPWRPPGNRTPTLQETELCLPFIERHIALAQPKVLLFLGGTAAKTLLNSKESLTQLRNQWHAYQPPSFEKPIPSLVLFHPAYLLRSPGQKRLFWMDLLKIKLFLSSAA